MSITVQCKLIEKFQGDVAMSLKEFHKILRKIESIISLTMRTGKEMCVDLVRGSALALSPSDQISILPKLSTDKQMYLGLPLFSAISFSAFDIKQLFSYTLSGQRII